MQRFNWFFRQKVTEAEIDGAFDAVEQMEFNLHLAQGIVGRQSQAIVTENSGTPNLTVDVSGPAEIRDQLGQRVSWTAPQDVDVSVDENSNSTAVVTPGNEKWLTVFAKFVRVESDPRLDGEGDTVQFNRAEGFEINVVQGAEAVIPNATRPALRADEIAIADVRLIQGQTQVLNADIDFTRRESAFKFTANGVVVDEGQVEDALVAVATQSGVLSDTAPLNVNGSAASAGAGTASARDDHKHDVDTDVPLELTDSTNLEGGGPAIAFADHEHAHGNRGGGALHAVAVAAGANGFLEGTDKAKIDLLGNVPQISFSGSTTTTSFVDVLMGGMTLTPSAGFYLVWFTASFEHDTSMMSIFPSLYVNNIRFTVTEREFRRGTQDIAGGLSFVTGPFFVSGSQTVQVRWKTNGGTATAFERTMNLLQVF